MAPMNNLNCHEILAEAGLLTDENRALVAAHRDPFYLATVMHILLKKELLTKENFALLTPRDKFDHLTIALWDLNQIGLLSQDIFVSIVSHANPRNLQNAFTVLHHAEMLTPANRLCIAHLCNQDGVDSALGCLQQQHLLTQENFDRITNHPSPHCLGRVLLQLKFANLINAENFHALILPSHQILMTEETLFNIWDMIPSRQLNQVNYQRLLAAAAHENPIAALAQVRDQIIGRLPTPVFNPSQSIHTASVHHTASASATKLMASYGHGLDFASALAAFSATIYTLDETPTYQAAKRCIARLIDSDDGFTDSSGISIKQLLALAFVAIHDDSKRTDDAGYPVSFANAHALLVDALYEIQRGYNLDAAGSDQDGEDHPICIAGTFSKLLEKLNGIHQDVAIYYITPASAAAKFSKVAQAQALAYLSALSSPTTVSAYLQIKGLIDTLNTDNSIGAIWNKIKPGVKDAIWEEFKAAYADNPLHPLFLQLMDSWDDTPLPNLTTLTDQLMASPGHLAYQALQERSSMDEQRVLRHLYQHHLWDNRHSSPDAQAQFDRQFGLVLKP